MQNLAGNPKADETIRYELTRCGIPVIEGITERSEVPYTIIGKLGKFEFRRAWYYYAVTGNVPLAVANILYADPVGKSDIRVAGHCGCPEPEGWAVWYADGKQVLNSKEKAEFEKFANSKFESSRKISEEGLATYLFHDNPSSIAEGFVEAYHIDSELGLYIFAETLRISGLA